MTQDSNTNGKVLVDVKGLKTHFEVGSKGIIFGLGANRNIVRAVDGVDLTIREGETLGLVGESGCGKSTLGYSILQLERPTDGVVSFEGTDLTKLKKSEVRPFRKKMQIVFQDPAEDPGNLHLKVDVVNCLVFRTPHSWWVSNADRLRQRMQYSYFKAGQGTVGPINWLGYENWSCTASPDGPVVPCQRHDLAYDSLQKFAGRNPENTPGGTPIGNELDQSWHPRNKSLADSKFFADINHYGCENRNGLFASAMCGTLSNWANAVIYHFFVADGNDRGWPVTDEDLADGGGPKEELDAESSEYKYIVCGNPVPRIANLSIEQVVGTGFDVSWNFEEGCVDDIAISDIEICLILKHGASVLKACRDGLTTSTTSKRFNIVSRQWRGIHFPIIGVEVKISPTNVSYGPDEYKQYWRRYPVRVR